MARRKPKQSRSRETVALILEAAAQILKAEGPEAASTNRVAKRAGLSVGSIYQYFPNKEALFVALARRHIAGVEAALAERLPELIRGVEHPEDVSGMVRGLIRATGVLRDADPLLRQRLFQLGQPETAAILQGFEDRIEGMTIGVLMPLLRAEHDAVLVSKLVVRIVTGFLHTSMHRDPMVLDDPRLEDELVSLIAGYLVPRMRPAKG